MILYVNGDSHAAGAQAVNDYCFANDDFTKVALGRKPHPDNLAVSWGAHLSKMLNLALVCDAEAASSNERILRTTTSFLDTVDSKRYSHLMVIIGWSNWERTEFLNSNNEYVQINPRFYPEEQELLNQFKKYVRETKYAVKQTEWHNKIWNLHVDLEEKKIPHLFFNANDSFNGIEPLDWNNSYIDPYNENSRFISWAESKKFKCNNWYHYGPDAHLSWAHYLLNWLTTNNISV